MLRSAHSQLGLIKIEIMMSKNYRLRCALYCLPPDKVHQAAAFINNRRLTTPDQGQAAHR